MPIPKSFKARAWCFTTMKTDKKALALLNVMECVWMIYQLETAPTTDKQHLQGAVYFMNPRSLKVWVLTKKK